MKVCAKTCSEELLAAFPTFHHKVDPNPALIYRWCLGIEAWPTDRDRSNFLRARGVDRALRIRTNVCLSVVGKKFSVSI